ncbi:hypothetical protein E2K93_01745 [Thalassotalea sp. HSM 43]|nr:hypothetical protein E2K93_01745 [Thalassotalea sp. HSM 43]
MRLNTIRTFVKRFISDKSQAINTQAKCTALTVLAPVLFASSHAMAQTNDTKDNARWFEIEVILLEQLQDKSRINENFDVLSLNNQALTRKAHLDLVADQLNQVVNYKNQLSDCKNTIDFSTIGGMPEDEFMDTEYEPVTEQGDASAITNNEQAKAAEPLFNDDLLTGDSATSLTDNGCGFAFSEEAHLESEYYEIPHIVTAKEDVYANVPYLLDQSSLKLSHIRKAMARSKNFRPLLHMGWRQIGEPVNQATPVRIIAGENSQLIDSEGNQTVEAEKLTASQAQQLIQNHIQQAITAARSSNDTSAEVRHVRDNTLEPLIEEAQIVDVDLGIDSIDFGDDNKDQQVFKIDGLFRVHLDHYLFINAHFDVLDENDKGETISIPFKQNRRVISGEVHYFDHPYMGMIVQIRRFTKPKTEAESAQGSE